MHYDPEGFTPSVNGVAYQVCVKTRYCRHLYSSLLRIQTWVGHRVYKSPYGESGEYTSPLLILTCAHTQILYSQSLLLTTKVRHISCMLHFMLRNRLWALLQGFVVVSFDRIIVYLCHGHLPWQDIIKRYSIDKYGASILEKKIASSKTLCQGLPAPFITFTQHIQLLSFDEKPQYD